LEGRKRNEEAGNGDKAEKRNQNQKGLKWHTSEP
jgi:hypothetical protein